MPVISLMNAATFVTSTSAISPWDIFGYSVMPAKCSPLMSISGGMPWLLNVSQIISRNAPIAIANSSVLSELNAQEPVSECPKKIKSANTVIAIRVS